MLKKILINIAQVLAALAVLAVLIFLAFKGSNLLLLLFSLAFISVAGMSVFSVGRALAQGEVPGRFGSITFRYASPIGFWFQIGLYVLVAGFTFFSGLALLGLAPHWFIALLRSMGSQH
jgi:hypothetical protein